MSSLGIGLNMPRGYGVDTAFLFFACGLCSKSAMDPLH